MVSFQKKDFLEHPSYGLGQKCTYECLRREENIRHCPQRSSCIHLITKKATPQGVAFLIRI